MPELNLRNLRRDFRLPELRLPEMSRDDIAKALGEARKELRDVRKDLQEFRRDFEMPKVDVTIDEAPRLDVAKAVEECAELGLPAFVAAEAGLSFLGLGLTGTPSLGKMVADATPFYADYGLYLWLPVGTITVLTLSLNLLGDSIRDAFDPRTRR